MSVTNLGKTRAIVADADYSSYQYRVMYQDSATTVALAGASQAAAGVNLFILQNAPTSGQTCELLELGSGNSYAVIGDSSAAIAAEMTVGANGKLVARTGTGVPAIARMRQATSAADAIAEVDTINPGGDGTLTGVTATAAELNILDGVTSTTAELNILDGVTATTAELNILDGVTATYTEINAVADKSTSVVAITDDASLTLAAHAERLVTVDDAAGAAITLPAATGTGNKYTVIIETTITSNSTTIKAASASDSFFGLALGVDTDAEGASGYTWNADSGDDTVTMDGGATGGIAGDVWTFVDFSTGKWLVEGRITQSGGSEATPFSATVS